MSGTPAPVAQAMQFEYPEIDRQPGLLALFNEDKTLFQYNERMQRPMFYETKGYRRLFFLPGIYLRFLGKEPGNGVNEPPTVVLSEEIARKIFGQPAASINCCTSAVVPMATTILWSPVYSVLFPNLRISMHDSFVVQRRRSNSWQTGWPPILPTTTCSLPTCS